MMPISAMTLNSVWQSSSARIAPTPADGSVEMNRDRMNVAFVQHAENDVDGDERGQNQNRFIRQRIQKRRGGALERGLNAGRHADVLLRTC